jgi:DNA-binding CsgD family transcriptional regulator
VVCLLFEQGALLAQGPFRYSLVGVGVFVALMALILSRQLTDGFATMNARMIILFLATALFTAGAFLLYLSTDNLLSFCGATVLLVLALCLDTLLWFTFISSVGHNKLILYFDVCFGLASAGILVGFFGAFAFVLMVVVSSVLFSVFFIVSIEPYLKAIKFPTRRESKQKDREEKFGWAKTPPLVAVGVLAGFPVTYCSLNVSSMEFLVMIAASLALAGVVFGAVRLRFGYLIEDFFFHFTPVFFCVGAFILPFTSGLAHSVCLVYLLLFAFVQIFIVLDAIAESVRLFNISSVWIMSTQFTRIFIGFAFSLAVTIVAHEYLDQAMANVVEVFILTFVTIFMTCFVPKTGYPNAARQLDPQAGSVQYHPRWLDVLTQVSDTYGLSPREREVLSFLAKGHTATAIAKSLFISVSTTRTHIAKIYGKLEIRSKEELLSLIQSERDTLAAKKGGSD